MTKNNFKIGYYIFLSHGDYHEPKDIDFTWTETWSINDWYTFIDKISSLGTNTLMIYITGHKLPFKSKKFPELCDTNHPNYINDFFSEIVSCANSHKIDVISVISTTGHAGKLATIRPNLAIQPRTDEIDLESLLTPFPKHIRLKKNIAKKGNAQVGFGTLCHNNPESKYYTINLINEICEKYNMVNGIALHPPESIYPCFCNFCAEIFNKKTGNILKEASYFDAMKFYFNSYIEFQNKVLEPLISESLPRAKLYCFTVPWMYENFFDSFAYLINKNLTLIEWDYNLDSLRVETISERISKYTSDERKVLFMPTSGLGLNNIDCNKSIEMIKKQVDNAIYAGTVGILYFVGPRLNIEIINKINLYPCKSELNYSQFY